MKLKSIKRSLFVSTLLLLLSACGGGDGVVPPTSTTCILGTSTLDNCTLG